MQDAVNSQFKIPSEEEIVAQWSGVISEPLVSIRCITYNHVDYIQDAIKGFLIQETEFPFEVWIHDDASDDGTREIIEKYQKKYPRIIKAILQEENQYSKGVYIGSIVNKYCTGKYIALCEGDDYWISKNKLSKQVSSLEKNPKAGMAFHAAYKISEIDGSSKVVGMHSENQVKSFSEILSAGGGGVPTASIVFRADLQETINNLRKYSPVGDLVVQHVSALFDYAYYSNEIMSVYRTDVPGSWSKRKTTPSSRIAFQKKLLNYYDQLEKVCLESNKDASDVKKRKVAVNLNAIKYAVKKIDIIYGSFSVYLLIDSFLKCLNNTKR